MKPTSPAIATIETPSAHPTSDVNHETFHPPTQKLELPCALKAKSANIAALEQMRECLRRPPHFVDEATIRSFEASVYSKFLCMKTSGICMATKPWLEFCGKGEADVAFRNPGDLLQGPLTQDSKKKQTRNLRTLLRLTEN